MSSWSISPLIPTAAEARPLGGIEVTGIAQRRSWESPGLPEVERVRPGLWSVPVPLPNNPLRYVLVYLLELDAGVAVIDTGWSTDEAWTALLAGMAIAGYVPQDVRAILVTHIHPDHYGLAGRLREASGAWIALHPADAALIPARYGLGIDALLAGMSALLVDAGVPEEMRAELTGASMGLREFVAAVQPDVFLEDRSAVPLPGWDLFTLHTPGHSPGHVCFHDAGRRLLFSGDHVLPRISPSVAVHVQQPDNPLADFLDALGRVRDLDIDEVLPAHEWRFRGLAARVDELHDHHRRRLEETEAVISASPGSTCWDVTLLLRWSRDWTEIKGFMRRAAVGETLAHLVLLERSGRVLRAGERPARWYLAAADGSANVRG